MLELVIQLISQIPTNQNRNLAKQKIYSSVMYTDKTLPHLFPSSGIDKKILPRRRSYNKW